MADFFGGVNNPGLDFEQLTSAEVIVVQQIAGLGDPNADRILFWDDSAGSYAYLTVGSGLTITGTTITADASTESVQDIVGAMVTGNTETNITVTYQDSDGTLDFEVADAFILNTGDTGTGAYDFGGASAFEIPNGTSPTVDAAGEIAIDTDADGNLIDQGLVVYHDGVQKMFVVAVDALPSTDDHVLAYDATADKFVFQAQASGVPTTITVADEAADATSFIAFFTAATGDLGPKTNANLTFNASTGVLTLGQTAVASITGNAGTLTVADEASDTTCFIGFYTAASGSLPGKTNTNMTFNASTGVATFASTVLTTTDINGGTVDGATIGANSASTIVGTTITANTGFLPDTDGGAYLGQATQAFSGLFLDTTATINFDNSNVVLTHSSGVLTMGTGELRITTPGTNAASVITRSSAATRTIVLTAAGGWPSTTAGAAANAKVETTTNDLNYYTLDFDDTTQEHAEWTVIMPDSYDGGTITAVFFWTSAAGGAGETVRWGIQARAFGDDDALDQAFGTAQEVQDDWIADGDVHVTTATSAITIGGTPAGGKMVQFKVYRDTGDAADDHTGDAKLMLVKIEYGINSYTD